jgi:hypothetical protein
VDKSILTADKSVATANKSVVTTNKSNGAIYLLTSLPYFHYPRSMIHAVREG